MRAADLPCQKRPVRVRLEVRRFACRTRGCPRTTFAERFPRLSRACARRTLRQAEALTEIAFANGGKAGAKLAKRLAMPTSRDTRLATHPQHRDPQAQDSARAGPGRFRLEKGDRYGTILVDLEARCPVDLLANREAASVARWLREHPGVKLISRDRAGVYAEGAKRGAPRAKQIADRYHLLVNLRDTLKTTQARYQNVLPTLEEDGRKTGTSSQYTPELPEAAPVADEPQQAEEQADEQQDQQQASANLSPLTAAERRRQISRANRYARYEQIIALHREGLSQRAIARQLHISRKVVHRSVAAGTFPERAPTGRRQSKLDPYLPAPLQALGRGLSQRPPTRA